MPLRPEFVAASVIEGPCPGLGVPSRDEAGNTYFSAWDYPPFFALYGQGAAPCVARVTPERMGSERSGRSCR